MSTTEGSWTTARPLRDSLYGDLVWHRPHALRRDLVLEAGSEQLAILRWEKLFNLQAVATCTDGRWRIGRHRVASLHAQVMVREAATEEVVATFTRDWRGAGLVRFASGPEYRWGRSGFWRSVWFWSSDQQERLIAYRSAVALTRRFGMEVDPAANRLAELPVLVMLGAYLMAILAARHHAH